MPLTLTSFCPCPTSPTQQPFAPQIVNEGFVACESCNKWRKVSIEYQTRVEEEKLDFYCRMLPSMNCDVLAEHGFADEEWVRALQLLPGCVRVCIVRNVSTTLLNEAVEQQRCLLSAVCCQLQLAPRATINSHRHNRSMEWRDDSSSVPCATIEIVISIARYYCFRMLVLTMQEPVFQALAWLSPVTSVFRHILMIGCVRPFSTWSYRYLIAR